VRYDVVLLGTRGSASLVDANDNDLGTLASSTSSSELVSSSHQLQANVSNERGAAVYALLLDARATSVSASGLATAVAPAA
jgi:hypothetical protein